MGRTNKLVDGCYSFWQGALFPLLQRLSPQLLAQPSVPLQPTPTPPARGLASAGGLHDGGEPAELDRAAGLDAASQPQQQRSSGAVNASGGSNLEAARQPAQTPISVPPLPEFLACGPAAAAAAKAAALKAAADAAVQAALAAQLATASAGAAAGGASQNAASERQRRELASERVRQLADTAGSALEVSPHVSTPANCVKSTSKRTVRAASAVSFMHSAVPAQGTSAGCLMFVARCLPASCLHDYEWSSGLCSEGCRTANGTM